MHFHLPKPLHGWREFAGEVGIIVVGVLIALGAEQVVESWNWSHKVLDARKRLAHELGEDLGQAEFLDRSLRCSDARLEELSHIVTQAQRSGSLPPLGQIGRPYWFTWDMGVWQSLIADQTANHFSPDELAGYTETYQYISSIDEAAKQENESWTALDGLGGPGRRFDPGEANFYLQAIGRARFQSRFVAGAGLRAAQTARVYSLRLDGKVYHSFADKPLVFSFCRPLNHTGMAAYGEGPGEGMVENIRSNPITRTSNGLR